jgi:hypothetical protein
LTKKPKKKDKNFWPKNIEENKTQKKSPLTRKVLLRAKINLFLSLFLTKRLGA